MCIFKSTERHIASGPVERSLIWDTKEPALHDLSQSLRVPRSPLTSVCALSHNPSCHESTVPKATSKWPLKSLFSDMSLYPFLSECFYFTECWQRWDNSQYQAHLPIHISERGFKSEDWCIWKEIRLKRCICERGASRPSGERWQRRTLAYFSSDH